MLSRNDFRPYQHRAVDFVSTHDNCALFMEMGLGKTSTLLTVYDDLRVKHKVKHMLVVAPLRVARDVWDAEIQEWAHTRHLTISKILGDSIARKAAMRVPADVHVINRENWDWFVNQIVVGKQQMLKFPWELVVIDESTSFRSQSSKRWKAMRRIRRLFPRLVLLTGTPTPNGLGGLWAQIFLLDQGQRLGKTETAYKTRWFNPPPFYEFGKWTPKPGAFDEIMAAIADITVSLRTEDYLTLPPVMTNVIKVKLQRPAMIRYQNFERQCILTTFTGHKVTAVNAGVLAGKLLQMANGAMYVDEDGNWELIHNEKIKALLSLLEDVEGPVLIAYNYKSDLERLRAALTPFCKENGKRFEVLKTEQSVREWNAGLIDFLLLHPGSAGHGLNLQHSGSETVIWCGLTWDGELHDQLNGRLAGGHRRVGRNVVIHYLVTEGTIDEDVMLAISEKKVLQDAVMQALSRRAGGTATAPTPPPR